MWPPGMSWRASALQYVRPCLVKRDDDAYTRLHSTVILPALIGEIWAHGSVLCAGNFTGSQNTHHSAGQPTAQAEQPRPAWAEGIAQHRRPVIQRSMGFDRTRYPLRLSLAVPGRVLAAIRYNDAAGASLGLLSIGGKLGRSNSQLGNARTGSPFSPVHFCSVAATGHHASPCANHTSPTRISSGHRLRTLFCSGTLALCRVLYGPRQLPSSTATRAALLPCLALRPFPEYPALISPKLICHHSFSAPALNHPPLLHPASSHHAAGDKTCPLPVLPPSTNSSNFDRPGFPLTSVTTCELLIVPIQPQLVPQPWPSSSALDHPRLFNFPSLQIQPFLHSPSDPFCGSGFSQPIQHHWRTVQNHDTHFKSHVFGSLSALLGLSP